MKSSDLLLYFIVFHCAAFNLFAIVWLPQWVENYNKFQQTNRKTEKYAVENILSYMAMMVKRKKRAVCIYWHPLATTKTTSCVSANRFALIKIKFICFPA